MNDDEIVASLREKLLKFRTPRDFQWLFKFLDNMHLDLERRYEKQREYFKTHKQELYRYHAQHRRKKKSNVEIS